MYAMNPGPGPATADMSISRDCGYAIDGDHVVINIAEIANNRPADDVSGTLSVELWALASPYVGADFSGVALAGTTIGEVLGQHFLSDCRYDLVFTPPHAGTWYLSLMLREWTPAGYVTRDHVNFALPYRVADIPAVVRSEGDNVISMRFGKKERSADRTAMASANPAVEPATAVAKTGVTTRARSAETKTDTLVADAGAPGESRSATVKPAVRNKPVAAGSAVSMNRATQQEIAAVKGISGKLAERIVASRPFKTLDDLMRVSGMGPKLLKKLRELISL